MSTKQCRHCLVVLSLDKFGRKKNAKGGINTWCKACVRQNQKEYRNNNAEKTKLIARQWAVGNPSRVWDHLLRCRYGISFEQYQNILQQQNNVCAICEQPESRIARSGKVIRLSVDHDHSCCKGTKSCGKCVRGLLCWRCNTSIGKFNDDINLIEKTITYLKKRKTK